MLWWTFVLTLCWPYLCLALVFIELDFDLVNTIGFRRLMKFKTSSLKMNEWYWSSKVHPLTNLGSFPFSLHFISPLHLISWLMTSHGSLASWFINDLVWDESTWAWLRYAHPLLFLCVVYFRRLVLDTLSLACINTNIIIDRPQIVVTST